VKMKWYFGHGCDKFDFLSGFAVAGWEW
jgi:hypothetical protein